jgi:hypothetical protein
MRRHIGLGLMALLLAGSTGAGCVVRERSMVARPGPGPQRCEAGVWIDGHYGPRGRWHPGHWRCRGMVERIEID